MSSAEKTHLVVILLALFVGGIFLLVVVGALFFAVSSSGPVPLMQNVPPVPTATSVTRISALTVTGPKLVDCQKLPKGLYLLVLNDKWQGQGLTSYNFKVKATRPDCPVKVLSKSTESPLPNTLKTTLQLGPVPAKTNSVSLTYVIRYRQGKGKSITSASALTIDLTKARTPQPAEALPGPAKKKKL